MSSKRIFFFAASLLCGLLFFYSISPKNLSTAELSETTVLFFPTNESSKDESNAFIYAIPPFKVSLSLPQGWHIVERASQSTSRLLAYSPLVSILDIYDSNGTLIGAVGYSTYEPFEGDSDSVPIVYSTIRLGANYSFSTDDAYEVVRTFSSGATATTNVIYRDGAASDEEINWGILAYDRTKLVFIAFEYDSAHTSREIVNEIAKTVEICE